MNIAEQLAGLCAENETGTKQARIGWDDIKAELGSAVGGAKDRLWTPLSDEAKAKFIAGAGGAALGGTFGGLAGAGHAGMRESPDETKKTRRRRMWMSVLKGIGGGAAVGGIGGAMLGTATPAPKTRADELEGHADKAKAIQARDEQVIKATDPADPFGWGYENNPYRKGRLEAVADHGKYTGGDKAWDFTDDLLTVDPAVAGGGAVGGIGVRWGRAQRNGGLLNQIAFERGSKILGPARAHGTAGTVQALARTPVKVAPELASGLGELTPQDLGAIRSRIARDTSADAPYLKMERAFRAQMGDAAMKQWGVTEAAQRAAWDAKVQAFKEWPKIRLEAVRRGVSPKDLAEMDKAAPKHPGAYVKSPQPPPAHFDNKSLMVRRGKAPKGTVTRPIYAANQNWIIAKSLGWAGVRGAAIAHAIDTLSHGLQDWQMQGREAAPGNPR